MTVRTLTTALKNSLMNYDPFIVAHLIKFEKPQSVAQYGGTTKGIATDYTYITDAQYDISYNDGTSDIDGNALGSQTYRANKVISLGTVNENIQAKASNMSLVLDSASLGASATTSATFTTSEMAGDVDLVAEGFQEGDKILLSGGSYVNPSYTTSGSGSNIDFTITKTGTSYTWTFSGVSGSTGTGFAANDTITVVGTLLDGSTTTNDLTLTVLTVNASGAILTFSVAGTAAASTNEGAYVRIDSFKNAGKTITFTQISSISANATAQTYTITLSAEEINILLTDKASSSYTNYINREVIIYKVHINPDTRAIIGAPYLYFKGITTGASIDEGLESSKVTWTLSSHWGDFVRVQGRLTDDATHRALKIDGSPDLNSVIRPDYATDLGFVHANTAVNHVATYMTTEIEYEQVDINGGWFGGKRLREVEVEVPRQTDLQFNLQAKMLPVVYGVRKVDSFPIFVDTHKDRSTEVYKLDAICEGKIAGILDIFVEGNGRVCLDKADFDSRSTGGANFDANTVEVICAGRADRGDTLSHYSANSGSAQSFSEFDYLDSLEISLDYPTTQAKYQDTTYNTSNTAATAATGILHEGTHTFIDPIDASFTFHQGKPHQKANNTLVSLAAGRNFKVQNDYYESKANYWSPSHRLLDTAYVVGKYKIAEGETTIPSLKYVVRGRDPECYNYDGSYKQDGTETNASVGTFELGDEVTLHTTDGDAAIGSAVYIIDKWSTYDSDGNSDHRFRFSTIPTLIDGNGDPITAFYMKKGTDKWHFQTWDHSANSGTVAADLYNSSFTVAAGTTRGRKITFTSPTAAFEWAIGQTDSSVGIWNTTNTNLLASTYSDYSYNSTTNVLDNVTRFTSDPGIDRVYAKNAIQLASGASSTDNYYVGNEITLTDNSGDTPYIQKRTITDYNGSLKVAIVDAPWDFTHPPKTTDTYAVGSIGDRRVTINPAMQLLDYMTNNRYGKGLDIDDDINLEAWKEAGRECDTRADVTLVFASSADIEKDDVWEYPATGTLQWRGTVSKVETLGGKKQVTFTDVIGKLGTKWNSYKTFASGELYWNNGKVYQGTGAVVSTAPSSGHISTVTLGNRDTVETLNVDISTAAANGNPLVKKFSTVTGAYTASGYSLYDSDDIKYWRYIGWDDPSQRNVTRHQMNQVIDTKLPLFDNINKMLTQFNGMLKYNSGKYSLEIKSKKGTVDSAEQITDADIIGTIKINDKGLKNSKNYVSTSIIDPANKFEGRSVSFFNSDYLKEDKGVQKKGQFSLPGVTNYFNARFNIKQFLDESRYGLTIQFTMAPRGLLLTAGSIIEFTYPRFGYTAKEFRITNLNFKKDGTIDVTADEHNDSAYVVPAETGSGLGVAEQPESGGAPEPLAIPARPEDLNATQTNQGEVVLTWKNTSAFSSATHLVEIYRSRTNSFEQSINAGQQTAGREYRILSLGTTSQAQWNTLAGTTGQTYSVGDTFTADATSTTDTGNGTVTETLLIGTSDTNVYHDIIGTGTSLVTRYYWIRYVVRMPQFNLSGSEFRNVPSLYYPNTSDSGFEGGQGVTGVGLAVNAVRTIKINPGTTTNFVYENDEVGIEPGYTETTTLTTTKSNDAGTVSYVWKIDGTVQSGQTSSSFTYTAPNNFSDMPQIVECIMTDTVGSEEFPASDTVTMTGTKIVVNGTDGSDGFTVMATAGTFNFAAPSNGNIASVSGFSSTFTVRKGTTTLSYDDSSPYDANSYRLGSFTNISPSSSVTPVNTSGTITISSSSGNFLTGTSVVGASFDVPVIDNSDGSTIGTFRFALSKTLDGDGTRGGSIFTFEESTEGNIDATAASAYAGTLTTSAAQAVAAAVIASASDSTIRPNDRITVTDNSASKAGTRVYTGSAQTASASVSSSDFSSLVVETFDGSVIVDGTLSANKISGGTISGDKVTVNNHLELSTSGKFTSANKTSYSSTNAGIFIGYDSNAYKINIGDATNNIKWDGSGLTITAEDGFTLGSNSGSSRTTINEHGVVVVDSSGVKRVELGNLLQL